MDSRSPRHLVQLYGRQDRLLATSVCRYLAEGLDRGEGVVAIAVAEHLHAFGRELRHHPRYQPAVRDGTLVLLDARVLLAGMLVDGQPDGERFDHGVGGVLRELAARTGRVRAYGEMVGLLWADGMAAAAIRLEEHWDRLQSGAGFDLFCAYPIDPAAPDAGGTAREAVLRAHTHLLPGGGEVTPPPGGQSAAPWLQHHLPEGAEAILDRARDYQYRP